MVEVIIVVLVAISWRLIFGYLAESYPPGSAEKFWLSILSTIGPIVICLSFSIYLSCIIMDMEKR